MHKYTYCAQKLILLKETTSYTHTFYSIRIRCTMYILHTIYTCTCTSTNTSPNPNIRTHAHTHTLAHIHNIHHSYGWKQSDNNISLFPTSFPFRSVSFRYFSFHFFYSFACLLSFFLPNSIHVLCHDSRWSRLFSSMPLLCLFIFAPANIPHDRSLMCLSSSSFCA